MSATRYKLATFVLLGSDSGKLSRLSFLWGFPSYTRFSFFTRFLRSDIFSGSKDSFCFWIIFGEEMLFCFVYYWWDDLREEFMFILPIETMESSDVMFDRFFLNLRFSKLARIFYEFFYDRSLLFLFFLKWSTIASRLDMLLF